MSERVNEGYVITQSIAVKNTEFVLGEHLSSGMYVTWVCKNGTDYYWGHYTENRFMALKDLCERVSGEIDYLASIKAIPPVTNPAKRKEYER